MAKWALEQQEVGQPWEEGREAVHSNWAIFLWKAGAE